MCIRKSLVYLIIAGLLASTASMTLADGKSYRPDNENRDNRDNQRQSSKDRGKDYRPSESKSDRDRDRGDRQHQWKNKPDDRRDSTSRDYNDQKRYHSFNDYVRDRKYDSNGRNYKPYDRSPYYSSHDRVVEKSYRPGGVTYRHIDVGVNRGYRPPVRKSGFYFYIGSDRPYHYGGWSLTYSNTYCRKSCYFYYGLPYVSVNKIFVTDYPEVVYVNRPVRYNDYYLSNSINSSLDNALEDIRKAWSDDRFDLIDRHIMSNDKIAVFLDGNYDYSMDGQDYLDMTSDAMDQMTTVNFVWERIQERADGGYTAFGKHTYRNSSDDLKSVYVTYGLQRMGTNYYITEIGSSASSL